MSPNRDKPSDQHQRTNTKVQSGTRADTKLNVDVLFSDCQAKNNIRCRPKLAFGSQKVCYRYSRACGKFCNRRLKFVTGF